MNTSDFDISLLEKPLWQMTGREFCALSQYAQERKIGSSSYSQQPVRISGVRALAEYIGCCESQIYHLRRDGVLEGAVISQVGKKIVFDGDKARELATAFQQEQRAARRNNG